MTLYVHEAGPSDASTIVFLHGGGLSGRQWQPQFEQLMEYHLLAPDLPAHGQSAGVQPFALDDAAQRVATIIREHAHGRRAHVVGLSLGGALALNLMRLTPDCVDHTIVSGTSAGLGRMLGNVAIASGAMLKFISPQKLADAAIKQFGIPDRYRDLVRDDLARTSTMAFNTRVTRALMELQLPAAAPGPLLVVVGEKETVVAKRDARKLVTLIDGARGAIAPGVGHVWNLQAPDVFSAMVHAWVTDMPLPAGLRPLPA